MKDILEPPAQEAANVGIALFVLAVLGVGLICGLG